MKMEQCSETSEFKIQTPGNNPKESIQHIIICCVVGGIDSLKGEEGCTSRSGEQILRFV